MKRISLLAVTVMISLTICSQATLHQLHKPGDRHHHDRGVSEAQAYLSYVEAKENYLEDRHKEVEAYVNDEKEIDRQITDLIEQIDTDGDGKLIWKEFIAAAQALGTQTDPAVEYLDYDEARELFNDLDTDHSGYIDKAELTNGINNFYHSWLEALEEELDDNEHELKKAQKRVHDESSDSSSDSSSSSDSDESFIQKSQAHEVAGKLSKIPHFRKMISK